ncbi:MAG: hypothetical protein P1V35_01370 [Planctomycetota bacterium]|nr:hypothetical protein [Planctomycetota bacterium]
MTLSRFLFVLPLFGVACQGSGPKVPEERIWPQWTSETGQYYGTPLGGPVGAPSYTTGLDQAWTFSLEVIPLPSPATDQGFSMAGRAAWVLDPSQGNPLRPTIGAAENTRWISGALAQRWRASLASLEPSSDPLQVAIAPGQTFAWSGQPAHDAPVHLTAFVSRPKGSAQGCTITLAFQSGLAGEEYVEFDTPWQPDQGPFTILWTPARPDYAASQVALALHLEDWNPDPQSASLAEALERGSREASAFRGLAKANPAFNSAIDSRPPVNSADSDGPWARALARAIALDSNSSQDWLMTCDEVSLHSWLQIAESTTDQNPQDASGLLRLEKFCLLDALHKIQSGPPAPGPSAYLVRQGGQLARAPEEFLDCVQNSRSSEELWARLVSGNRGFLEHESPAARLRAFEWLKARDLAPPGYDPLERSSQRRRALQNWKLQAPVFHGSSAHSDSGGQIQ